MQLVGEEKSHRLVHAVYDVKSLDNRHHFHVSVDLVIVAGNRPA